MGPGICGFSWKRVLARQQPWCCGICLGHRQGGVRVRGAARHVGAGQVCTHLTLGAARERMPSVLSVTCDLGQLGSGEALW